MKLTTTSIGGLALLLLTQLLPASAQTYFPPSTTDTDALTAPAKTAQNGVLNTGTDVIKLNATERLQVMVWDNGNGKVTLSTVINAASNQNAFLIGIPNSPQLYTSVSDPDVAMGVYNGQLYADVVYLASYTATVNSVTTTYTRTFFDSYLWDNTNKRFDQATRVRNPLGVEAVANLPNFGPDPIPRVHSSPNIDVNAAGRVGIVWQEKSTETAQVTVLSPSYSGTSVPAYPNGYTYISEGLVFAESYLQAAFADGSRFPNSTCSYGWRGSLISALGNYTTSPTPAANNAPILANQTLLPDVAVGADGKWWITYLVSAAVQGEPPVRAGLNLVLRKVEHDCRISGAFLSQSWQEGVTLNPPRVAASPNPSRADDVEVVQAWAGTPCQEGFGTRYYYEIRNWGRSAGAFRSTYNLVSQVSVTGTNGRPAYDPVVAFYGSDAPINATGSYVVAWSGDNYPANASERDVWSRSLTAGVPTSPDYSRVHFAAPDNTKPAGSQRTPSVAARYSGEKFGTAYAWADEPTATVRYRYANALPGGSGQLNRPAAPGSGPATNGGTGSAAPARTLEAFPNPFGTSVEFRVSLQPGEAVQSIQVTDLSGRVLDAVPVAEAETRVKSSEYAPPPYIQLGSAAGLARWLVPGAPHHQPAHRNPATEQKLTETGPPQRPTGCPKAAGVSSAAFLCPVVLGRMSGWERVSPSSAAAGGGH